MNMRIIFCDNGFSPKEVDYMYAEEFAAASKEEVSISLISFEELKRGHVEKSVKRIKPSESAERAIYRGWMLKPHQYDSLYKALLERNIELINKPEEYLFCHYLPESYELIKDFTPKTTFKKLERSFRYEDFFLELKVFGEAPIIVKDYVKSQKHYWNEACYIPNAANKDQVTAVVNKFLELQGEDFNEGLVFRSFLALEQLSMHSVSKMPLTKEFRLFVKDGKIISVFKYWDEGDYEKVEPVLETFESIIPKIKSHFFTMDIAKKQGADWIIVELGDGQVAGLPGNINVTNFYNQLCR